MAKKSWFDAKAAKQLAKKAGMKALREGAESILTESINETPVLSGTLRRSGTVTDAPREDSVYISYNTPYARRQHEELSYRHPGGGKAKYLEDPFNRLKDKVMKLARLRVKKALKDAK